MVKTGVLKFFVATLVVALVLSVAGCSGGGGGGGSSSDSSAVASSSGGGNKGPFKQGSLVVAYKLNANGTRDINTTTHTTDGRGHFSFSSIPWSGATEFVISGEYLNENTGTYMTMPANPGLSAIVDLSSGSSSDVNINILTNIAAKKIKHDMNATGASVATAKAQAQDDIEDLFNLNLGSGVELEDLDLTDGTNNVKANTQLLRISSALLDTANPQQVMEQIATDMTDGSLDDEALASMDELQDKVANVDLQVVATKMEEADIGVTNAPSDEDALNGTLSFDHNMSFTPSLDAYRDTEYVSNNVTVSGIIGESGDISIVNGSYSIDGAPFTSDVGRVANGQIVKVKITSSTEFSKAVEAKLTIGGGVIPYVVTTMANPIVPDTTPDDFSFGFERDIARSVTNIESKTITITGINVETTISIDSGEYKINSGSWTSSDGNVSKDDNVTVRRDASDSFGDKNTSTVTIGGVSGKFSVFTVPEDTTPDIFTFSDVNDVNKSATPTVESNQVTINGINTPVLVSVSGGFYKIDGGSFTDEDSNITNAQSITLKAVPSDDYEATTTVTLRVGDVVATFNVTTMSDPFVPDTTPNEFSFDTLLNQEVSTDVEANITVSGINIDTPVSITNGTYVVNSGGQDANVSNGDVITVTQTTSDEFDTEKITTLTIGGVSATFKTKTKKEDTTPDDFSFDSNSSVPLNTEITSNTITINGLTNGTSLNVAVENGEYEINGGGFTNAEGSVSNGDTITLKQTSANTQSTSNSTKLTVGNVIRSFTTRTQENQPYISGTPAVTIAEDSSYSFTPNLDTNSGEVETWSIVNKPSWAIFNDRNGRLEGTPQNDNVGVYTDINITATNAQGSSSIFISSLEVTNTNDAPVAQDINVSTNEDNVVDINTSTYVNDVDINDTYTIVALGSTSLGTVSSNGHIITYTPTPNISGIDSFTYTVRDSAGEEAVAHIDVNIMPVNDAPVAVNDSISTNEDTNISILFDDLLANDEDIDSNITITSVTNGANGSATISGGSVIYAPNPNFNGADSFIYTISDGEYEANATVNVTVVSVNDVAVISGVVAGSVVEDITLNVSDTLTVNDVDINESELVAQTDVVKTYGTFNIDANGSWSYTLNNTASNVQSLPQDINVTDTITVTSKDGTASADITVTIAGTNDVAVIGGDITAVISEDAVPISKIISVDDNDTAQSEIQALDVNTTYGSFEIVTDGHWTYTLTNTPDIQALADGEELHDSVTVTSKDGSATQDVNITIRGVNDTPSIISIVDQSIKKQADLNITLQAQDVDHNATLSVVRASASDGDGHDANVTILDDNVTVTFNAQEAGNYTLSYTFADEHGAEADGSLNVNVTVSDPPVAVADSAVVNEDENVSIDVLANDTDDNDAISSVAIESNPLHGNIVVETNNTVIYTPAENYNGVDSFRYKAIDEDGGFATADVNITINAINDAPVANDDANTTLEDNNITINVVANDYDVDGDELNITAVTQGANGSVTFTSTTVTYSPNLNFAGNDSFMYTLSDGNGGENNATVTVAVTPQNDAPVIASISDVTVLEDANVTLVDINASDVDSNITINAFSTDPHTASVDINGSILQIIPQENMFGAVGITVVVTDDQGLDANTTFMFTITPVNDAPVARDINVTALFNDTNDATDWDILGAASDVDDTNLTIDSCDATSANFDANITFDENDILTYSVGDHTGWDEFNCTITDGNLSDTATVHVLVSGNHAPTTTSGGSITMTVDEMLTGRVFANDIDANDTLTYSVDSLSGAIDNNGTTFDPSTQNYSIYASSVGRGQVVIRITDDGEPSLSTTATFNVNVIPLELHNDPYEYSEGGHLSSSDFDNIDGTSIPADTNFYSVWGTDDDNNDTTLDVGYLRFNSDGSSIVPDGGPAWHNGDASGGSITGDSNGMVSISMGGSDYDENSKIADTKMLYVLNETQIASELPSIAVLSMPEGAVVYKMAHRMTNEKYKFEREVHYNCDQNNENCSTYGTLEDMVDNNAHGIVAHSESNHYRIVVFGNDQNLSSGSGTVVELDMTDVYQNGASEPYVVNPNAGTWEVVRSPSVDDNNSDIIKVHITVSGYDDEDVILVDDEFNVSGEGVTHNVWKGEYRAVNRSEYEYRFNDIAISAMQNAYNPVSADDFMDLNITRDINATEFDDLNQTIDPTGQTYYEIDIDDDIGYPEIELTQMVFDSNGGDLTIKTYMNGVLEDTKNLTYTYNADENITISNGSADIYAMKLSGEINSTVFGLAMPEGAIAYEGGGLNLIDSAEFYDVERPFNSDINDTVIFSSLDSFVAGVQEQNSTTFAVRYDGNDSYALAFEDNSSFADGNGTLVEITVGTHDKTACGTWKVETINGEDVITLDPCHEDYEADDLVFGMDGEEAVQRGEVHRAGDGHTTVYLNEVAKDVIISNFENINILNSAFASYDQYFRGKTRYFINEYGGVGYRSFDGGSNGVNGEVANAPVSGTYETHSSSLKIFNSPKTLLFTHLNRSLDGGEVFNLFVDTDSDGSFDRSLVTTQYANIPFTPSEMQEAGDTQKEVYVVTQDGDKLVVKYTSDSTREVNFDTFDYDADNAEHQNYSLDADGNLVLEGGDKLVRVTQDGTNSTLLFRDSNANEWHFVKTFGNKDDAQNYYNSLE